MAKGKPPFAGLLVALAMVSCSGGDRIGHTTGKHENSLGVTLVRIDPGTFTMGSDRADLLGDDGQEPRSGEDPGQVVYAGNRQAGGGDETPRQVTLTRGFLISESEVTVAQWAEVMNEGVFESDDRDMPQSLSWYDAVRFCNALSDREDLQRAYEITPAAVRWDRSANGYRLPTEAEWEYAARAGTVTPFFFGEMDDAPYGPITKKTIPIKRHQANPWGLYDVHGNLWEWCWDGWGPYDTTATVDPVTTGVQGPNRVIRGGGACGYVAGFCSSSFRLPFPPLELADVLRENGGVGLRLARFLDSAPANESSPGIRDPLVVHLGEPAPARAAVAAEPRATGTLRVTVSDESGDPVAVEVSIDGRSRGTTPWEGSLEIGVHQLRLPWHSRSVTIRAGEEHHLRVTASDLDRPETDRPPLVLIKAGTFNMGTPANRQGHSGQNDYMAERQHRVTLTRDFLIGATEVTRGQWAEVMDGETPPDTTAELPKEDINWVDVVRFCNRLSELEGLTAVYEINEVGQGIEVSWEREANGYRLPTEAEWEYAARAGTRTSYFTGSAISTDQANFDGRWPAPGMPMGLSRARSVPVGSFAPNGWGLFDFHGNVAEWVWDRYAPYPDGNATDPTGPEIGDLRILRGGSFFRGAKLCRSADRYWGPIRFTDKWAGFRVARFAS